MGQAKWKIQLITYGSTILRRAWWQTPKTRMFRLNVCNSIRRGNRRRVATPLIAPETAADAKRERDSNEQEETTYTVQHEANTFYPIFKSKIMQIFKPSCMKCQEHIHRISCRWTHAPSLVPTSANVLAKSQYQSFCDTPAQQICL